MLKKFWQKKFFVCGAVLVCSFFAATSVKAQNIGVDEYIKEYSKLKANYDAILDYQEFERCIIWDEKEEFKCNATEPTIQYMYKSTTPAEEQVFNKNTAITEKGYKVYSGDTFYKDEEEKWKIIEYEYSEKTQFESYQAEKLKSSFLKPQWLNNPLKIYSLNAQTIYSSSGDGYVSTYNNNYTTWSEARNSTTGAYLDYTGTTMRAQIWRNSSYWSLFRSFIPFDIEMGTGICASSSKLYLTPQSKQIDYNDAFDYFNIVHASQDNATELLNDDFDNIANATGTTNKNIADAVPDTAIENVLNATANSWIVNNEYLYLGVKIGNDIDNNEFGGASGNSNSIYFYTSENTGTSKDPYLLIATTTCEQEATTTPEATTTIGLLYPENMCVNNDLSIICGMTQHYESTTTLPDWVEYHYFHVPFIVWIIFWLLLSTIFSRVILEIIIRFRDSKKK